MAAPPRILVIDDDPSVTALVCEALAGFGYHADGVTDGREGLSRIVAEPVDLVVLDLGLPDVDGQHILARLQFYAPRLPVVVISGTDDPAVVQETLAAGARSYLVKPIHLSHLVTTVAEALRPAL